MRKKERERKLIIMTSLTYVNLMLVEITNRSNKVLVKITNKWREDHKISHLKK